MEYTKQQLKIIYDDSINKELHFKELQDIKKELELICPIVVFDEFVLQDIIDTLFYFKNLNLLNTINKESLDLLLQIFYASRDDMFDSLNNIYFTRHLRNLLLPFNMNRCDEEYNITNFLNEFDIFINLIKDNCNTEDYKTLKKYNTNLYEISGHYYEIMNKIEKTYLFRYSGIKEKMQLNGVITHLATLVYFSLDKYNYQYDLLDETLNEIFNNIIDFFVICDRFLIFQDILPSDEQETLREYKYCVELLDKQFGKRKKL